ncbi:MAG: hypothetical protein ACE5H9_05155 [Anaerolineae bacterium]
MAERPAVGGRTRDLVIFLQKSILSLSRHWFLLANLVSGTILALGFLAPALMYLGLPDAGQGVYRLLAPHDHQLPQRSYFLFAQKGGVQTYSLEQVLAQGADPDSLRAFIGNPQLGFKMALNQRMTAILTAIFIGGLGWGLAGGRPRLGPLGFLLMTAPLLVDGYSHVISENSGQGFRESNAWAVGLTGGAFPPAFYAGTTFGSLNWLLRTLTGLLFGLSFAWFLFTYLSDNFAAVRKQLEPRLRRIGAIR